ncbi:hypothetical protein WSM22_46920 [Cytophagales bacterium WSM2-2]|nr:hypothetical protein WSM22_46920 [Cytophagales bacterium WSM2-2]
MKNLIVILVVLSLATGCSQRSQKEIEITGFASVKVDPDVVKVRIESFAQEMAYTDAVAKVNLNTDKIVNTLKSNGFTNLKSVNFQVQKLTDYSRNYADKGHRAVQTITLEFPVDKDVINKIINLLSDKDLTAEYDFRFELTEQRRAEARNSLVKEAVKNATGKMELLAKVGSFKVGKILKVNYKEMELVYDRDKGVAYQVDQIDRPKNAFSGLQISPVEITDDVSVVWEIK